MYVPPAPGAAGFSATVAVGAVESIFTSRERIVSTLPALSVERNSTFVVPAAATWIGAL